MAPRRRDLEQRARVLELAVDRTRARIAQLRTAIADSPQLDFGQIVPGGNDQKQMAIELDAMRAEVAHARRELGEKTKTAAENEHELQTQIDALRDKLEITERRMAEGAGASVGDGSEETLRARIKGLEAEVRASLETIERLHKAGQNKVEQMAALQSQFQEMQFEISQLGDAKQNLQRLLDEWRSRARDAERERDTFKQRAEQASSTANRLQSENDKLEERVRELQDTVSDLNKEITVMEKRTEHLRQHLRQNSGGR